jgi:3-phenylpropionate/cinnamic acid dioxygenase small subunit
LATGRRSDPARYVNDLNSLPICADPINFTAADPRRPCWQADTGCQAEVENEILPVLSWRMFHVKALFARSQGVRMDDRTQIEDIIYTYAALLDDGEWDAFAKLFVHGELSIQVNKHDRLVLRGPDEVKNWLHANVRLYENGTPKTSHVNTNVRIELDSEGRTARASTYMTVFQKVPAVSPKAVQVIMSGRYNDSFTKIDGKWTLTRREEVVVSAGDLSAHAINA